MSYEPGVQDTKHPSSYQAGVEMAAAVDAAVAAAAAVDVVAAVGVDADVQRTADLMTSPRDDTHVVTQS